MFYCINLINNAKLTNDNDLKFWINYAEKMKYNTMQVEKNNK